LGGFVERVVVAVAEAEAGRVEAAGAVADQVDDRAQFVGHCGWPATAVGTGKYIGRTGIMGAAKPDLEMFNRTALIIVVVALAAGLGLIAAQRLLSTPAASGQPETSAITLFPQPRELPDFALQQSDGTQLLPGELHGHWTIVFIGFTFCPDVCPTTLAELAQAQRRWEDIPEAIRPRVLFVSVDPERDTPDRIGDYLSAFHRDTLGATADLPALEELTRSMSLVFMK